MVLEVKRPVETLDLWAQMPIFDTKCFIIRVQLEMALYSKKAAKDLGKHKVDPCNAPLIYMIYPPPPPSPVGGRCVPTSRTDAPGSNFHKNKNRVFLESEVSQIIK